MSEGSGSQPRQLGLVAQAVQEFHSRTAPAQENAAGIAKDYVRGTGHAGVQPEPSKARGGMER